MKQPEPNADAKKNDVKQATKTAEASKVASKAPSAAAAAKDPQKSSKTPAPPARATQVVFAEDMPIYKKKFGCFFKDGKRRVDYVLVWEESVGPDADVKLEKQRADYRRTFERNILDAGVEMERNVRIGAKKRIHFVKLFVSWQTMCTYAEYLGFRAPLEQFQKTESQLSHRISRGMRKTFALVNFHEQEVPNQPMQFYTCAFNAAKLTSYIGSSDQDAYFRPSQRFEVAFEILGTTVYGKKDLSEVGLDRMVREGIYACGFPPHEGSYEASPDSPINELNTRQILCNYWARWGLWYKYQPLDHIREYFGEKIAFYFAFLGIYTAWLAPASIAGLLVFFYSAYVLDDSPIVKESCSSGKTYKMCPMCAESEGNVTCNYWYLSDICSYIKAAYLFDNDSTVVYSLFVSFWACTFLEQWKRKSAALAYQWDVFDFVDIEERPRPEFSAKCTEYAEDPVTGTMEPHFPDKKRFPRLLLGALSVVFMMLLSFGCLWIMLMVRAILLDYIFSHKNLRSKSLTIANGISAVVNLILVLILELLYEKWAVNITEWEMHRTQTQFENKLIFKVFIFELFNHYLSIAYTALVKGHIAGKPGEYNTLFGKRLAECINGSCMLEVTQVLAVITVGKQILVDIIEILLPKLITFLHRSFTGLKPGSKAEKQWEADYNLIPYDQGLFMEYLEVIMQFGFITVFVPAFPLAPLFALINNVVEIRLDAKKLVCGTRRPLPERAQGIGVWFSMLEFMVTLSTLSNAFLMAFTSEFLPTLMYRIHHDSSLRGYKNYTLSWAPANTTNEPCRYSNLYTFDPAYSEYYWKLLSARIAFALSYQQFVVTLSGLISGLIPDINAELEQKIKHQKFLAKQTMTGAR